MTKNTVSLILFFHHYAVVFIFVISCSRGTIAWCFISTISRTKHIFLNLYMEDTPCRDGRPHSVAFTSCMTEALRGLSLASSHSTQLYERRGNSTGVTFPEDNQFNSQNHNYAVHVHQNSYTQTDFHHSFALGNNAFDMQLPDVELHAHQDQMENRQNSFIQPLQQQQTRHRQPCRELSEEQGVRLSALSSTGDASAASSFASPVYGVAETSYSCFASSFGEVSSADPSRGPTPIVMHSVADDSQHYRHLACVGEVNLLVANNSQRDVNSDCNFQGSPVQPMQSALGCFSSFLFSQQSQDSMRGSPVEPWPGPTFNQQGSGDEAAFKTNQYHNHHSSLSTLKVNGGLETTIAAPSRRIKPHELKEEDFRWTGILGNGSSAQVYSAIHIASGHAVALKEIPLNMVSMRPGGLNRLISEVNVHRALKHPHVVRLLTYFVTPRNRNQASGSFYLVMELCPEGNLKNKLHKSDDFGFSPSRAKRIIRCLVSALIYMHSKGVIHRDLKLENVLLSASGIPKLADFGFALDTGNLPTPQSIVETDAVHPSSNNFFSGSIEEHIHRLSTVRRSDGHNDEAFSPLCTGQFASEQCDSRMTCVGTLDYLSPEMLTQKEPHTTKTDVWSLGIMLVEMLTGMPPFYDPSPSRTAQAILEADIQLRLPAPNANFPEGARNLISEMLLKDPNQRPSMEMIAQHPWLQRTKGSAE